MFSKLTRLERTMLLSFAFTLVVLAIRVVYSASYNYLFYPWNLFLAAVLYMFARRLTKERKGWVNIWLLAGWLLFFPNAPYLITDVFHFEKTNESPSGLI